MWGVCAHIFKHRFQNVYVRLWFFCKTRLRNLDGENLKVLGTSYGGKDDSSLNPCVVKSRSTLRLARLTARVSKLVASTCDSDEGSILSCVSSPPASISALAFLVGGPSSEFAREPSLRRAGGSNDGAIFVRATSLR